jgi:integrase
MHEFIDWYCSEPGLAMNRGVVLRYRLQLESKLLAAATINVRLAAVRRLATKQPIPVCRFRAGRRHPSGERRQLGRCVGNWLTAAEGERLLLDRQTLPGKRDAAIVSLLLGCALRRSEAVGLKTGDFQRRDGPWAIVDHVRTVPVPGWERRFKTPPCVPV